MWTALLLACAPALPAPLLLQGGDAAVNEPAPIAAPVVEVTVYGRMARVVRRSAPVARGGGYLVRDLPGRLRPEDVRMRCVGGHVVELELRERVRSDAPDERVEELRARLEGLRREQTATRGAIELTDRLWAHLEHLAGQEARAHVAEVARGNADERAWETTLAFLERGMDANRERRRAQQAELQERATAIADLEAELGRLASEGRVKTYDLLADVALSGASGVLEIEYLVDGAGWQAEYDLRASRDARSVELTYRARVHQETGEDWRDVELLLSTAMPERGAQGPEPRPAWVDVYDPDRPAARSARPAPEGRMLDALGYEGAPAEDDFDAEAVSEPDPFSAVEHEGLSARFRIPKKETVESRGRPGRVLVGKAVLASAPELHCAPALDRGVWLRGIAKNESDWVLLPGQASVFYGDDYLGKARVELVQPGEELTLHLGAVPAIAVELDQTEDRNEGPGFLGSRRVQREGWRLRLENAGVPFSPDGGATVVVRLAVPRSTDERLSVALKDVSARESQAERWKKEREDEGIHTWELRVPRGGEAALRWRVEYALPKDQVLQFR